MTKKIMTNTEYFVQFTDDEIQKLGWEKNQKFTISEKDGGILLSPFSKLEIDISDFSREILEMLIIKSIEDDISVNEVINQILEKTFDELEIKEDIQNGNV